MNLTHKEQRFVDEYLVDVDAIAAARRAGFGDNAAKGAIRLLADERVKEAIRRKMDELAMQAQINALQVLERLREIVEFDILQIMDDTGEVFRPPSEWPEAARRCVAEFEVEEMWEGEGDARRIVGYRKRVELASKSAALDTVSRMIGLMPPDEWPHDLPVSFTKH